LKVIGFIGVDYSKSTAVYRKI